MDNNGDTNAERIQRAGADFHRFEMGFHEEMTEGLRIHHLRRVAKENDVEVGPARGEDLPFELEAIRAAAKALKD